MPFVQRIDNGTYLTVTDDELVQLYAYPAELDRVRIRVNFVSSIDGAVSVDGRSGGLGTDADHAVFTTLRDLADAVLVGASTVSAEDYGGVKVSDRARTARRDRGQAEVPPVVIVSGSAAVEPGWSVITDTEVPPVVVVSAAADADRVRALRDAGARVEQLDGDVTGDGVVAVLDRLGLRRVLCEGGPGLFSTLLADDVVDEVCLTTSPVVTAGDAGRIATSESATPRAMSPAHVLLDDDGTVLVRWVRDRTR